MSRQLPSRPNVDHLKEQAKDLLAAFKLGEEQAFQRVRFYHPEPNAGLPEGVLSLKLSDAQVVLAREYGFESWPKLKEHVEGISISARSKSLVRALNDLREGKCCILFDDESRENEGDIVFAAEKISPEAINFMTKYGRGTLCLAMTEGRAETLNLHLINPNRRETGEPAFLQSVDAAKGVTTGVSAFDRACTIQVAVSDDACSSDLKSPGHIFPLQAHKDGLRARAGHTEGSVELAKMAGLKPAAVICEILNDDGTMARWTDLARFSTDQGIQLVRISELK
jgi:3,4-dihydroxy-2-butanone 4-phosphate synthase